MSDGGKAEPGFIKRRNRINGQFRAHMIEMVESPAWKAISLAGRRVIDRIEIELAHHGGNDNGRLPVTKLDFAEYGIYPNGIASAVREAEALGFIRVTERGRGGNAEHRQPNLFFLTFAHARNSRALPPTHDWRKIKTIEEAEAIAKTARENKDLRAVQFAEQRTKKTKHRYLKQVLAPVPKIGTENPKSPVPKIGTTGSGRKQVPLSISRVGGDSTRIRLLPWSTPTVTELFCKSLGTEEAGARFQPSLRGKVKDWEVRSRVIGLLNDGGTRTVKEIMAGAGVRNRRAADMLLHKLVNDGIVERAERGIYRLARSGEVH
jgi:hypothetical protein